MVDIGKRKCSGRVFISSLLVIFWLASVVSAMGVVYSTFEARKATQKLEELRREASGLKVMSGQFLLERSSLSAYSRVENIANEKLNMVVPKSEKTVLVYKK